MGVLRWGIAGAGSICDDFTSALRSLPTIEHEVVAIAARDLGRAAEFAKKFSVGKSYGSYEELAKDPGVDVVYIGTINSTHYEICKLMLENNKHVLCEKSLTLLLMHTEELIQLAEAKKLFFQEAVWSRFFPAYQRMKSVIVQGAIGDVKLINITFCKRFPDIGKRALGGGVLMSLGVYPLQFVLAVCGSDMPEQIYANGILNEDGVDIDLGITLRYKSGPLVQMFMSSEVGPVDEAIIYGTKGSIKFAKKFHAAMELSINGVAETFSYPDAIKPSLGQLKRPGFVFQAQEVKDCIEKRLLESPRMTHHETTVIAKIMEEVMKQIGLNFRDLYR